MGFLQNHITQITKLIPTVCFSNQHLVCSSIPAPALQSLPRINAGPLCSPQPGVGLRISSPVTTGPVPSSIPLFK